MGSLQSTTGLISGLNIGDLAKAAVANQQAIINRLNAQIQRVQGEQAQFALLQANVLSMSTAANTFKTASTFEKHSVTSSDPSQFIVTGSATAVPGEYNVQAVQKASTHQLLSKGFANSNTQTVGAGTLTITTGGKLNDPTLLDALNNGNGISRGTVRVTDRSGASASIDLSSAVTVEDVLEAFNSAATAVTASVSGGQFLLTDTSGGTGSLTVADLTGASAADLGLKGSYAASTVTGTNVYQVTDDFPLELINDGNKMRLFAGSADLTVTLTNDQKVDVNLDGSFTLRDVVEKINAAESNAGKVTASVSGGRLVLTDNTAGGGAGVLSVADGINSSVVHALGLDESVAGPVLTGKALSAGMNSVLLRNLNGGQGVTAGTITITNRANRTANIDLSGAESLHEVLDAINGAQSTLAEDMQLVAELNAAGTGIVIRDESGGTAANFSIADATGSLAADLNILIDSTETQVDSGRLGHRFVNAATSLSKYAPDGGAPAAGLIQITDSSGKTASVSISSAVKTIGDVIQRINAATGIAVRAELNETGDGFVIIDEAGGGGTLKVGDLDSTTAADLRLDSTVSTGSDGAQRISSRFAAIITVEADDTLDDVVAKINEKGGFVSAGVINDQSAFNSTRLSLTSATSGRLGELVIEQAGGLNLGLSNSVEAQDAVVRLGGGTTGGFLVTSASNTLKDVIPGVTLDLQNTGTAATKIKVNRDFSTLEKQLDSFVSSYNTMVSTIATQTSFDSATNKRGALQGNAFVLRLQSRISGTLTGRHGLSGSDLRNLAQVGVRSTVDGKLTFDKELFNDVVQSSPSQLKDFFVDKERGFGQALHATLQSLTDPIDGSFHHEDDARERKVGQLQTRIEELTALMVQKQQRVYMNFVRMENLLSTMESQRNTLNQFAERQSRSR